MTRTGRQVFVAGALVGASVLALTGAAGAQKGLTFGDRKFAAGDAPERAVAGDLDGDGATDLVVVRHTPDGVSVLLGDGADAFGDASLAATGHPTLDVALGDVDGDGALDAVTVNDDDTWSVLLGDGEGQLAAPISGPAAAFAERLALGDLDGDGDLDLVVNAFDGTNVVQVLLGDGTGAFAATASFGTLGAVHALALGDLDGDGDLDLVGARQSASAAVILLGDGAGGFGAATPVGTALPNNSTPGLQLADFDADGALDVIVSSSASGPITRLLRGDGAGGIASELTVQLMSARAVDDVDGDGRLDLLGPGTDGRLMIGLNDGASGVAPPIGYHVGPFSGLIAARLDGDTLADVVTLVPMHDAVAVIPGRAFGPPATAVVTIPVPGIAARCLRAGDVTGDGWPDLVESFCPPFGGNGTIAVARNNGAGAFTSVSSMAQVFRTTHFLLEPVTPDAELDVLALADSDNKLHVLKGDGDGHFVELQSYLTGTSKTACLASGDLDGDGDADVVVGKGGSASPAVAVLLSDGAGAFSAQVSYTIGGDDPVAIALGDLNGDERLDVVTANRYDKNVSVLLGDGAGGLLPATEFGAGVGSGPTSLVLADFDGDGALDAATANAAAHNVSVLRGNGAGGFAVAVNVAMEDQGVWIHAADLDDDGDVDLVVTVSDDSLALLLNDGEAGFTLAGSVLVNTIFDTGFPTVVQGALVADLDLDGLPDLATPAYANDDEVIDVRLNLGTPPFALPWSDLGGALAGAAGKPLLTGKGNLHAGVPGAVHVASVIPAAPALMFVSIGSVPHAFKGGTLQALPAVLVQALSTGAGSINLNFLWPAGVPSGLHVVFQCAIADAAAVQGVALSNALDALTP